MRDLDACRRPLLVQPHYDDNDLGGAGTVRRWADQGAEVTYLTVTDDVAGVLDAALSDDEARSQVMAEQEEAGRIVGVARQIRLEWPDAGGLDHVVLRDQLIDVIREVQPDIVLTVDPRLPDEAHTDHLITAAAVNEAVLLGGLARVRPGSAHGPWSVPVVGYYFTAAPDHLVDTSEVQGPRHAALDCYRAQLTDNDLATLHRGLDRRERQQAAGSSGPKAVTHAEALRVIAAGRLHVALPALP